MKAYKCDICGELYEMYPVDRKTDNVFGTNILSQGYYDGLHESVLKKKYELCRDCCASFNCWLESRKDSRVAAITDIYEKATTAMKDYAERVTNEEETRGN